MTEAEQHGYLTGVDDISLNRWDGDNAMPPYQFMQHMEHWYIGYNRAYDETKEA